MIKMDLISAYNQLELHKDDRHLTSFLYHSRKISNQFQYCVAPMGLSSSSKCFLEDINKILSPSKKFLL